MSVGDELKGEFFKAIGMIGILVGFVILFSLFSISIWLVIVVLVIIGAAIWLIQSMRSG